MDWQPRSVQTLRATWAALTADPGATNRELRRRVGVGSIDTIRRAKQTLRAAGYIDYQDRTNNTTRIIVPFVTERK
jgi:hypothetical protein